MIAPEAWKGLHFIASPWCDACGHPFEFTMSGQDKALCGPCLAEKPKFSRARAAIAYDDGSRDFILGFKHGDQCHSVPAMLPWLKTAGREVLDEADILAPVPLHRFRLLRRRYNQAALMAHALSRDTGIACIPDLLRRVRPTPPQGHLNVQDRAKNVRKAFQVEPRRVAGIRDKKIVLIDDVYTTGATVNECAEALLSAGASDVRVLTLARIVKPSRL